MQESGESFDSFVSSLRQLSLSCNYGPMREEMIKDRIVIGVIDSQLRRALLQQPKLSLKSVIECGRATETTKRQLQKMTPAEEVSAIRKSKRSGSYKQQVSSNSLKNCKYCGKSHEKAKEKCPAFGKICGYCSKRNHFEIMCMIKKKQGKQHRKVNMCEESSSDSELECVETVRLEDTVNTTHTKESNQNKLFMHMQLNKKIVRFLIDTGATVNVVNRSLVPEKSKIEATTAKLRMYNNTQMTTVGKTRIPMKNPKNSVGVGFDFLKPVVGFQKEAITSYYPV